MTAPDSVTCKACVKAETRFVELVNDPNTAPEMMDDAFALKLKVWDEAHHAKIAELQAEVGRLTAERDRLKEDKRTLVDALGNLLMITEVGVKKALRYPDRVILELLSIQSYCKSVGPATEKARAEAEGK
jgi:uncharacterized small protein (DUF1192 family)